MQCSPENTAAEGAAEAPPTFTLCLTSPDGGTQVATAGSITALRVNGDRGFAQAVEQALDEQQSGGTCSVWLDIASPSAKDIICLSQIFDMDSTTTGDLLSGTGSRHGGTESQQNGPWPACKVTSRALYLCWQETIATEAGLGQYFAKGTVPGQTDTATEGNERESWWAADLVPVPQWLMPSASKAVSGYHLSTTVKLMVDGTLGTSDAAVERARQQYVQQLLSLLDKPRRRDMTGLQSAIRRWGTQYERWAGLLGRSGQTRRQCRSPSAAGDVLGVTRALVGSRVVQVWVQGPIVLTFHREPSQAISDIQRDLGQVARPISPDSILHGLLEHWAHATSECLPVLERLADRLDHDLTRPAEGALMEASQWTPVIVRCRKVALALLRRYQENEYVLAQLCRHMRDRQHTGPEQTRLSAKPTFKTLRTASNKQTISVAPGGRLSMRAIAQFSEERRAETLVMQYMRARGAWALYKKAEMRLSRLHRILLDRQCLRVLEVAHKIHQRFRYLVMYEVIYLPMELWNNLDNMNGIETPGELQGDHESVEDFYWTLVGLLLWAGAAGLLYSVYSRFFAPTSDSWRVKNIRDMRSRRQKYQQRLQEMYEQSRLAR